MKIKLKSLDLSRPASNWLTVAEEFKRILPNFNRSDDQINSTIHIKLFLTGSPWTWYIVEGQWEEDDYIMYGLVYGFERELGYISLKELSRVKNKYGLGVEIDSHFTPVPLSEVWGSRL